MSRAEENRFAACYHSLVALLLLLLGGGSLALAIWMQVSDTAAPLDLDWTNSSQANAVLGVRVVLYIVGGFLIVTALASLVALGRKCVGLTFRVIYIVLALIVLAIVACVATVSWLLYARSDEPVIRKLLDEAWQRTITTDKPAICRVERTFKCRGFQDNTCTSEKCAQCPPPDFTSDSCYHAVTSQLRRVLLPAAIVSTVMGAIVLMDIFVTCAL